MSARTEVARQLETSPPWRLAARQAWPLRRRLTGPAVTAGLTGLAYLLWGWR